MNQIRRLSHRVIWVDGGSIRQNGPAYEVVSAYESAMASGDQNGEQQERSRGTKGRFVRWEIAGPSEEGPHVLRTSGELTIKFMVEIRQTVRKAVQGVALFNQDRQLMWGTSAEDLELLPGLYEFAYEFPMLPLKPGPYSWLLSLWDDEERVDLWEAVPNMVVATISHQHPRDEWTGVLNLPSKLTIRESARDSLETRRIPGVGG
jgi:hypothetical protein